MKNPSQPWPLMLFLHGAQESGTNLASLKKNGPPKYVETHPGFPFILVSPQYHSGNDWDKNTLMALLDDVIGKYRVDTRRIYLTGLSMGGSATWSLAAAHPGRFAAIVPVSGVGNPADAKKLAALPIWVFHGAKDTIISGAVVPANGRGHQGCRWKRSSSPNSPTPTTISGRRLTTIPSFTSGCWLRNVEIRLINPV